MDLELDGPYALRIRNFIGNRNTVSPLPSQRRFGVPPFPCPVFFSTILQLLSQRLCLAFLYLVCGSSRIVAPTRFLFFWPVWHRTLTPGTPPALQFLFNGGDEKTVAFINRYYGFDIKPVPVRLSQFSQIA